MMKKLVLLTALVTITSTTHTISWGEFWSGVDAFLMGYGTTKAYGPGASRAKLKTNNGKYNQQASVSSQFSDAMAKQFCSTECTNKYSITCASCKKVLNMQINAFLNNPTNKNACIGACKTYTDLSTESACTDICNRE